MTDPRDEFEDPPRHPQAPEDLVLSIDGYEGPIDLLLQLARDQKLDLTRISILQLAEQYLAFIDAARQLRLELAADYLVMAAWLAYLKSRLLIPQTEEESSEPTGEELADALAFQLRRLEAMQEAAGRVMARPQLGRHVFARGEPSAIPVVRKTLFDISYYDLLNAFARLERRNRAATYHIETYDLHSIESAIERLEHALGRIGRWTALFDLLPDMKGDPLYNRSALASTFAASLELAKAGRIIVRQDGTFGAIYLQRRNDRDQGGENGEESGGRAHDADKGDIGDEQA